MKTLTVRIRENMKVDVFTALTAKGKPYTFIKGVPMKIPVEEAKELVNAYKALEIVEEKKERKTAVAERKEKKEERKK